MGLGWDDDVNESFVLIICSGDVDLVEVSDEGLNFSFSYLYIYDGLLVPQSRDHVPVLLVLVGEI